MDSDNSSSEQLEQTIQDVVSFAIGAAEGVLQEAGLSGEKQLGSEMNPMRSFGQSFGALSSAKEALGGGSGSKSDSKGSGDNELVKKGATMGATVALQGAGVPPPLNSMAGKVVGEKVGQAYEQAKSKMDKVNPTGIAKNVMGGMGDMLKGISDSLSGNESKENKEGSGNTGKLGEAIADIMSKAMDEVMGTLGKALSPMGGGASSLMGGGVGSLGGGMSKGGNPMSSLSPKFGPMGGASSKGSAGMGMSPGPSPQQDDDSKNKGSKNKMGMKPKPPQG